MHRMSGGGKPATFAHGQAVALNANRRGFLTVTSRNWTTNGHLTMRRASGTSEKGIEDLLRASDLVIAECDW